MSDIQELQEMIGSSAGEIYNYLNVNGETTFSKMKKELQSRKIHLTTMH